MVLDALRYVVRKMMFQPSGAWGVARITCVTPEIRPPKTNMAGSKRERALAERNLVCLLQACEGHQTIVELRNESFAEGVLSQVDGYMNINMNNVQFTKQGRNKTIHLDELFIQAKQIRFVHIPDGINMREAIEGKLKELKNSRTPMCRKFQKNKK